MPTRLIIDTDTAGDDCFSLLLGLRHPAAKLEAVTICNGNVAFDQQVENALHTIEVAGRGGEVPVYLGSARPLMGRWEAASFHGSNGMSEMVFPPARQRPEAKHAIDAIIDLVMANPGEISISLTEREPYALWQVKGELFVIAADGTVIDKMDDGRFAYLPLVVGKNANNRASEYLELRKQAGPLAEHIRAGMLVSDRRWDIKLDNGMDVRLPETKPEVAMQRLVSLEESDRILDKDILALDLRQPDRVVARLSEEAAAARAEMLKNRNKAKKKGGEA